MLVASYGSHWQLATGYWQLPHAVRGNRTHIPGLEDRHSAVELSLRPHRGGETRNSKPEIRNKDSPFRISDFPAQPGDCGLLESNQTLPLFRRALHLGAQSTQKAPPTGIEPVSFRLTTERSKPAELWRRKYAAACQRTGMVVSCQWSVLLTSDLRFLTSTPLWPLITDHRPLPQAEGEGFEPSSELSPGSALAPRRDRPLCQPSGAVVSCQWPVVSIADL